jgi:hypothetical protein
LLPRREPRELLALAASVGDPLVESAGMVDQRLH